MRGEEIHLTLVADVDGRAVRHEFVGRLSGDAIRGTVLAQNAPPANSEWHARRIARGTMKVSAQTVQDMTIAEEQR